MTTREILTIQLGHYSNFIGTHWWNLQETNFSYDPDNPSEINHDVLYREGENFKKQVTFTPRLLLADLKGTLGYLKESGTLYSTPQHEEASLLWDKENIEITEENIFPKPAFIENLDKPIEGTQSQDFNLENSVNTWVDYLVPRFHSRTVNTVREYEHNSSNHPFDIYTYGRNLWNTEQFSDDFTDRIRAYVEECDLMQGFQILVDSIDGFAGLGVSCIQHLRDEYGKSILAFPCINGQNTEPSVSDLIKAINIALCWQHIGEYSSLFSPLCCGENGWPQIGTPRKFDNLSYELELKYHTSSILATALDTLSLRYRRKEYPNVVLSDLCADLNKLGWKAVATSLSLPFPMTIKRDLIDILDDYEGSLWTSLTPSCDIPMDKNMQSIALRGISEERLKRPMNEAIKQMSKPAYRCSTVHEMMTLYLACTCHASATYLSTIKSSLKIQQPYPKIFNTNVTETGDIAGWPVGEDVRSVPVMAGLHSGSSLASMYESLHNQVQRIRSIKKFHAFTDSGLEEDEFSECLNHLLDCKETYEDHYI
uniref:protein misato n=1 Tax=Vespula vulgaris TaxID=7454 RepID=UPI002146C40E|nr:protein misato [Vespula vulgaris]